MRTISLFLVFLFASVAFAAQDWMVVMPFNGAIYPPESAPKGSFSILKTDGTYLDPEVCVVVAGKLQEDPVLKAAKQALSDAAAADKTTRSNAAVARLAGLKACVQLLKGGAILSPQRDQCLVQIIRQTIENALPTSDL